MKKIVFWLLVTLAFTNVSFFNIGMAAFTLFHCLVIVTLFFSFFVLIKQKAFVISQPKYYLLAATYLIIVNLFYLNSIKVSSFIFSLIILMEVLLLYNLVKKIELVQIRRIIKTIIGFYLVNILVATFLIKIDYYNKGLLGNIFKVYVFDNRIRPYGFSDEPSYAAIILVFSLYVLMRCNHFSFTSKDLKWYVFAIIAILLTGSSYGYMLLALLILHFLVKSNLIFKQMNAILKSKILTKTQLLFAPLIAMVLLIIFLGFIDFNKNKSVNRLVTLFYTVISSEGGTISTIRNIAYVDGSASMRLAPTFMLRDDFKQSEWKYVLFGHGAGQSVPFFSKLHEGQTTILGFIPSFVYNYGIVGTALFLIFFISLFPKSRFTLLLLFSLFVFNADFNTQIFLFVLFSIMVSKRIEFLMASKIKTEMNV